MKTKKFNMVPSVILCLLVHVVLLPENSGLASASIQCQDNNGNPVDWFIIYKMPKLSNDYPPTFKSGKGFYYLDEHQTSWKSGKTFDIESKSALKETLDQIYTQNIMYIMYNDQLKNVIKIQKRTKSRVKAQNKIPIIGANQKNRKGKAVPRQKQLGVKTKTSTYGHLKGTLGFDDNTGFWLIHSAPRFPPKKSSGFSWADNASDNGQMFLCVSFDTQSLDDIAKQLFTMQPNIYDQDVSSNFKNQYQELKRLLNKEKPTTESIVNLSSLGGLQLKSFAKHGAYGKAFSHRKDYASLGRSSNNYESHMVVLSVNDLPNEDLYECLVAPELRTDMEVETWMRGSGLPNSGSTAPYKIYNIQEIEMLPIYTGGPDVTFKETKDHSKFAVSFAPDPWVCIGDINRELTQFKRGGGTLCLENQTIADAFRGVVHTDLSTTNHPFAC